MSPRLTRRELDLMSVLWRRGSASVTEVREELEDDISYSTVMTVLRTLESKGHVRHVQDGRAFRFIPVTGADEAGDSALRRILSRVYHGSRDLLVNRLVEDEEVSVEELRRIKERLEKRLKEMGG